MHAGTHNCRRADGEAVFRDGRLCRHHGSDSGIRREVTVRQGTARRLRRIVAAVLFVVLVLPVALILPFRWIAPPVTAFMLEYRLADGTKSAIDYHWVDWDQISRWAPLAMVASEDQKF